MPKLFALQGVLEPHAAVKLRRKVRDTNKLKIFTAGKRVTDLDSPVVMQADDVSRESFICSRPFTGKKCHSITDPDVFTNPHMTHFHALKILS